MENAEQPTTSAKLGQDLGQLSALPAAPRLPGSQQHFQPPCHRDIRSVLSQAAGAGSRWAGT